jgi:hypothetical protein
MRWTAIGHATPMLRVAAAALAAEAAGLLVSVVFNLVDAASGQAWTTGNAIGLTVVEVIVAAGVAWIGSGVARARPWSRTPAVMVQLFTILIAIWLLQAQRYEWGAPALVFGLAGLAGLFAPTSLRALNRER